MLHVSEDLVLSIIPHRTYFQDNCQNRHAEAILTNIQIYVSLSIKYNVLAHFLITSNCHLMSEYFVPVKLSL